MLAPRLQQLMGSGQAPYIDIDCPWLVDVYRLVSKAVFESRFLNSLILNDKIFSARTDMGVYHSKAPVHRLGVVESFLSNQKSLRRFISRYLVSSDEIEDVSQEAFLRAYRVEQSREIAQPKAFLFRIAKNLILSEFSKKSRKITGYIEDFEDQEVLLVGDSLENDVMAQQKLGIYCEAVASLPPQCQRVVLMKKVYGMSHKEIAKRLGIAVSTVEKHLAKGIRECNTLISIRYQETPLSGRVTQVSTKEVNA